MNVHKNARLTPSGRVLLVQRIESGWRIGDAAAASGVSVRTAYEWLADIVLGIGSSSIAVRRRTVAHAN